MATVSHNASMEVLLFQQVEQSVLRVGVGCMRVGNFEPTVMASFGEIGLLLMTKIDSMEGADAHRTRFLTP